MPFISTLLVVATAALLWDTWWHVAIGRDTFWEPPHIILYLAVSLATLSTLYSWLMGGGKFWRKLLVFLLLIPLSAPFDELWHRAFGVENLNGPLVIWSPPHILLLIGILGGLILCLSATKTYQGLYKRQFFELLVFAAVLSILFILVVPFLPRGPYEVLGFWGAGVVSFILIFTFLSAQKVIPGIAEVTMLAFFFLTFTAIGPAFSEKVGEGILIPPHGHQPPWLIAFAYLMPAIFMDIAKKWNPFIKGLAGGILWSGILFGFSSLFLETPFQYSTNDGLIAFGASIIGAGTAAFMFQYLNRTKIFLFA